MFKQRVCFPLLLLLPTLLFAGTFFEDEKTASDVFIAERAGVSSLFVNPAGSAGKTGFEISADAGFRSTPEDADMLTNLYKISYLMADGHELDQSDVAHLGRSFSQLYRSGALNNTALEAIFASTALSPYGDNGVEGGGDDLDWSDTNEVASRASSMSQQDLIRISNNFGRVFSGENSDFIRNLASIMKTEILAGAQTGFIINGFGLGLNLTVAATTFIDPHHNETVPDNTVNASSFWSDSMGIKDFYTEFGIIGGGGLDFLDGKISVGATLNYSILTKLADPVSFQNSIHEAFNVNAIKYGYSWGLDVGAIFRPIPILNIGVVLNDVLGYAEVEPLYSADNFMEYLKTASMFINRFNYQFMLDVDAGITLEPDWSGVLDASFGFEFYNLVGYLRGLSDNKAGFAGAMYDSLEHFRIGAKLKFFDFFKVGTHFYNHYFSVGLGFDMLFFDFFTEFKLHDTVFKAPRAGRFPLGADVMVRFHF